MIKKVIAVISYFFLAILELIYRYFNVVVSCFPLRRPSLLAIRYVRLYDFLIQTTPLNKLIEFPHFYTMLSGILFDIALQ